MHTTQEVGIDDFRADRATDECYRTGPLKRLCTHAKGDYYRDGRFTRFGPQLADQGECDSSSICSRSDVRKATSLGPRARTHVIMALRVGQCGSSTSR